MSTAAVSGNLGSSMHQHTRVSKKGYSHEQAVDIEQMPQESLLKRFGQLPAPKPLEFLHDNGPEYLEYAFQKQLKEWNIINCNTPT